MYFNVNVNFNFHLNNNTIMNFLQAVFPNNIRKIDPPRNIYTRSENCDAIVKSIHGRNFDTGNPKQFVKEMRLCVEVGEYRYQDSIPYSISFNENKK